MLQCLSSTNEKESKYLTMVAKTWWDEIWVGKLDWINVWLDLNAWVIKKLNALSQLLPYKECWSILCLMLEEGLPAAEICRNMHREIVHGPLK